MNAEDVNAFLPYVLYGGSLSALGFSVAFYISDCSRTGAILLGLGTICLLGLVFQQPFTVFLMEYIVGWFIE